MKQQVRNKSRNESTYELSECVANSHTSKASNMYEMCQCIGFV